MQKRTIIVIIISAAAVIVLYNILAPRFSYKIQEAALERSIANNDFTNFKAVLRPDRLRRVDYERLVTLSCRFGRLEMLRLLVGDQDNRKSFFYQKPNLLFEGIGSGNPELVKYLLENGAVVSGSDEVGRSPISVAVWSKKPKTVEVLHLLVRSGAEVELQPELKSAIRIGQTNVIKLLLDSYQVKRQLNHKQIAQLMNWCENNERQTKTFLTNYFFTVPQNN